ncbi:MAG: DNA-binding protein, partial [Bacillaceae bacterium]|nr:DNA-binding protein [Bacillaceae bacterium]
MILTERRKQFLRKLVDLYQKTNVPVHYETLAKYIGVSKW